MAMELLGVAGMTEEMKTFYDKKMLSVAQRDTVFLKHGVKRPIPPRGGKVIEFRRFEKIVVTSGSYSMLTEGTHGAVTMATISAVTATVSQFGQWSQITDVLNLQSYDPILAEYADKYGIAMAESLDYIVRDTVCGAATTIQYAGAGTRVGTSGAGAVSSGAYFNEAEALEAKRTLRRNGARPPYTCFIHPDNTKDLMEDSDIRDDFRWGDYAAIKSGNIGQWMGINFIETNNLRIRSSYGMSGADIYEVLMIGNEFFGVSELSAQSAKLYYQKPGGVTDPLEQYSTVGWKASLGARILNQDFGVLVNCVSSRSNSA